MTKKKRARKEKRARIVKATAPKETKPARLGKTLENLGTRGQQ